MRNAIAIAKKELNIYFTTPIAYAMFTVATVVASYFFINLTFAFQRQSLAVQIQAPQFAERMNLTDMVLVPLFVNIGVIFIFIVPFLTMRLVAEEKRLGTFELLFTAPLRPFEIVAGKFLAAIALVACTLLLTLLYPALLSWFGTGAGTGGTGGVEWQTVLTGYLGLFLLGAAFMSVGLFLSALTSSQVVAAIVTFVALLLTWVIGWAAAGAEGTMQQVLNGLSAIEHLLGFVRGVVKLDDLVYYLSAIALGLFLTHRAIEAQRWT